MKHHVPPLRWSLLALVAFAGCQDPSTTTPAEPVDEEPDVEEPALPAVQLTGIEGYPTPGEVRTGFIIGRDGMPTEVRYEVQGELAIWEGDIVIGRVDEIARSAAELMSRPQRGVVIDDAGKRWPGGVIPYEIDGGLTNAGRVTDAIAIVEEGTEGVTVVPRNGEDDYVRFVDGDGCSSPIGRQGGSQNITLASGCSTGSAAHEILHSLGMYHEHTRCDRDEYVIINEGNIEDGREHNFDKNCSGAIDIDVYDEGSIMHYGPFAFSTGGKTIEAKPGEGVDESLMGQRDSLGVTDVITISELYGENNQAPTASIGALAASYPEGSSVPFDGTGSSDPDDEVLTYSWSFGDGTCSSGTPPAACTQLVPSHVYADDGAYTVTLTVSDGFAEDETSETVTIVNVDPVVDAGSDASVDEGSVFERSGSFTDPGDDTWTATVDYGDGSGEQALALAGKTFSLSHTYVDNGSYTVTVTVTDDDGGSGSDAIEVTVLNVAPTVDAGLDASVTSSETFDFTGTFSDPGIEDDPWEWVVAWGDGAESDGTTHDQSAPIEASHQVCAAGDYTVTLSVTDKDGGTGSDDMTLTVPYLEVEIAIMDIASPAPINLRSGGVVPVVLFGSATFDAAATDLSALVLGDEVGGDTPVAVKNNGSDQSDVADVDGDGFLDLVVKFEIPALVDGGDLDALSTELVLRGFLDDACTNFRGVDAVTAKG